MNILSVPATLVNTTANVVVDVRDLKRIFVQIAVTVAALTGFAIKIKPTSGATYSTVYSTTGDFIAPRGIMIGSSGDLTNQPVGTGWVILDVVGLDSVTLSATSAGTANIAIEVGGE